MDRPEVLPPERKRRLVEPVARGTGSWCESGPRSANGAEGVSGLDVKPEASLYVVPDGFARETPAEHGPAELTQLGAQLRLEMLCYVVSSIEALGREWSELAPERRFSLSLTWQYLVTGRLPALHRHYLLGKMTREQLTSYEAFLKDLISNRAGIERLGFFPPWRTLEIVTAQAVLEREIPGKLPPHGCVSRPAGRHPDGRRKWRKRMTDRLKGSQRSKA